MQNIQGKYIKDEGGNIVSPIVSIDTIYNGDTNIDDIYLKTANTSYTPTLTSGTKIGSIQINGISKDIFCKNTTYSAGTGISLSGTTFSNSGVRSIATGDNNGTIKVNTGGTSTNVSVKGLGSAAYMNTGTTSSTVALGSHTHNYAGSSSAGGDATRTLGINISSKISGSSAVDNLRSQDTVQFIRVENYDAPGWASGDGFIISFPWDDGVNYGCQLALDEQSYRIAKRGKQAGTWQEWRSLEIEFGTSTPSGGKNGDVYIQY